MIKTIFPDICIWLAFIFSALSLAEEGFGKKLIFLIVSLAGWFVFMLELTPHIPLGLSFIFLLAQVLAIAGLFLTANAPQEDLAARAGFILCFFSVIGVPPLLGFWPKFFAIIAAMQAGLMWQAVIMVLVCLLIMLSMLKLSEKSSEVKLRSNIFSYSGFFLGGASLVLGLVFKNLLNIFSKI